MTNPIAAIGAGFYLDNVSAHCAANLALNPTYDVGVMCSGFVEFTTKFHTIRSCLVRHIRDCEALSAGTRRSKFPAI
jgi:hypothetical protein